MKQLYIIGNWKSNKNTVEAKQWLYEFATLKNNKQNIISIVCPPLQLLSYVHAYIEANDLPLKIGAQNISPYGDGAFTGEVNARQIKEFASYVIIGHSERRQHFSESDQMLDLKVKQALQVGLEVIFCVQNESTPIPENVQLVAFEPVSAIGSGNPDSPKDVEAIASKILNRNKGIVIYGGSVTAENVHSFTSLENIHGVLAGGESLDPDTFSELITYA